MDDHGFGWRGWRGNHDGCGNGRWRWDFNAQFAEYVLKRTGKPVQGIFKLG